MSSDPYLYVLSQSVVCMLTSEHHFSLFLCFSSEHMFSTQSLTQMMLGLLGLSTLHGPSILRTDQSLIQRVDATWLCSLNLNMIHFLIKHNNI